MHDILFKTLAETFSRTQIKNTISINYRIVKSRGESFGVNEELLFEIFDYVNSFNDIKDKRQRIIKKAANLLGRVVYEQPFDNGNKSTSRFRTALFLKSNGFILDESKEIDDKLAKLLYDVMFGFDVNDEVDKVESFLLDNVDEL